MLRLELLGAPAILLDGRPAPLSAQKAQALLFYLAAGAGRPFTRGQLIALLWEESGEREGRNSLSTTLSRLRQALPALPLRIEGDTLAWEPSADVAVDLHEFQALALPAAGRPEAAAALYRGPFLDGFEVRESVAFEEWLRVEREHWQYRALNLLDQLIARASASGALDRAFEHARRAVAIDPLQERFHRALMRLLARSGDRAAALGQFRACRELLERELGVEPDPETVALERAIRAGDHATHPELAPPAAERAPAVSSQLPPGLPATRVPTSQPPTVAPARLAQRLEVARRQSFVGREVEQALFAEALVSDPPPFSVLHLVGPGGVGKTTLLAAFARHAAAEGVPVLTLDGRTTEPTPAGSVFQTVTIWPSLSMRKPITISSPARAGMAIRPTSRPKSRMPRAITTPATMFARRERAPAPTTSEVADIDAPAGIPWSSPAAMPAATKSPGFQVFVSAGSVGP